MSEITPTPPAPSDSGLTIASQFMIGTAMMVFWLLVGACVADETVTGGDISVGALSAMVGFFGLLVSSDPIGFGAGMGMTMSGPPSLIWIMSMYALVACALALWFGSLFLPFFSDWRSRVWLLFLIQNSYAAINALALAFL